MYKPRTRVQIRTNASFSAKYVWNGRRLRRNFPLISKALFIWLSVILSLAKVQMLVQLLGIYFLVLAVKRSRSGARFLGPAPLPHPIRSQSSVPPPLEILGDHRTHLHVYIPSCGKDASTPTYLISSFESKCCSQQGCGRSASAAFPASAYRMRAPANHFAAQMQPHHRFVATRIQVLILTRERFMWTGICICSLLSFLYSCCA